MKKAIQLVRVRVLLRVSHGDERARGVGCKAAEALQRPAVDGALNTAPARQSGSAAQMSQYDSTEVALVPDGYVTLFLVKLTSA
jgi:hypothetical protein